MCLITPPGGSCPFPVWSGIRNAGNSLSVYFPVRGLQTPSPRELSFPTSEHRLFWLVGGVSARGWLHLAKPSQPLAVFSWEGIDQQGWIFPTYCWRNKHEWSNLKAHLFLLYCVMALISGMCVFLGSSHSIVSGSHSTAFCNLYNRRCSHVLFHPISQK